MPLTIPFLQFLLRWWYYWGGIQSYTTPQLHLYTDDKGVNWDSLYLADFSTIAGDGFPQDLNPYSWAYSYDNTGVMTFRAPEIDYAPTQARPISGWIIVDPNQGNVLMGERLYAPRKTIAPGETLKIKIVEYDSDHGPPCL